MEKEPENFKKIASLKEERGQVISELVRRKEAGELDKNDFTVEDIWHLQNDEGDRPVERRDLESGEKPRALVVSIQEFYDLGYFDIVLKGGERLTIFAKDFSSSKKAEGQLIIFPEELGNSDGIASVAIAPSQ